MTTSRYKSVLITTPDQRYIVASHDLENTYKTKSLHFAVYHSDLVIRVDRYPEYELIKHLPCKDIFNYFIEDQNHEPNSRR